MSKRAKEAAIKTYPMLTSPSFEETSKIIFTQMDRRVAYIAGYEQAEKELTPLINRLCEAILFEWKDAAELARKALTQIKEGEEEK